MSRSDVPGTLGDLLDIDAARLVVIHDAWTGYNEHSPILAAYELRRGERGGLSGEGRLSTRLAGERVVEVAIAAAAAKKFLGAIAGARIASAPPEPHQKSTDDYPRISIALHVGVEKLGRPGGIALLFTESQGEFHAPWSAAIGGRMWTMPGEEIGRALVALKRPLKWGVLEGMMRG